MAKAAKSKLRNEVLNEVLLNLLNHRVNPRLKSVTLTLIPRLNGYMSNDPGAAHAFEQRNDCSVAYEPFFRIPMKKHKFR